MTIALAQDIEELFARVDAVEARQAAIDSRQGRIERLLGEQQVQLQSQTRQLATIGGKMSELVDAVRALAPKPPPPV